MFPSGYNLQYSKKFFLRMDNIINKTCTIECFFFFFGIISLKTEFDYRIHTHKYFLL